MTVEKLELIADRDALQVGMTARVHAVEVAFDQDGNETHTVELALVEGDVALVDPLVEAILAVERGELGFSDLVDLAQQHDAKWLRPERCACGLVSRGLVDGVCADCRDRRAEADQDQG